MINTILNNQIFLIFSVSILLLIITTILLYWQLWQTRKRLKVFFNGKKASDLEGVIFSEIKRMKQSEEEIQKLIKFVKDLDKMTKQSIQKIGLVRFNPFKDTGGDQSFTIALLDSYNNGLIISSLYSREGTRIYSKPIIKGQSTYPLSKEETESLKKAGC